mmetsp:Transcript_105654/g.187879  ORF Transcript_105654/g.187879 Transcript_105654/m.187879 type:complete len:760 (+) Transcript_105654:54-2333(+)
MKFRERSRDLSRQNKARAVVPLPSLDFVTGDTFYKKALSIVRERKQEIARSMESPGDGFEEAFDTSSIVPSVASAPPRRPREKFPGADSTPKYLRLACVLHRPQRVNPPPVAPPTNTGRPQRFNAARSEQKREAESSAPSEKETMKAIPMLFVTEAALTMSLRTLAGKVRIPPYTWLVLGVNDEDAANIPVSEGETAEVEQDGSLREEDAQSTGAAKISEFPLSLEASGGSPATILGRSVPMLRLVSQERLTLVAAEANFQRCSRGSSLLALKHAAYILKVLVTKQNLEEVMGRQQPPENWEKEDLPTQPPLTLEAIDAKVRRVQGMVASRAAESNHRAALQTKHKQVAMTEKAVEEKAEAEHFNNNRLTSLQKGFNATLEFLNFATRKYGNCVRAWFQMDPEENMKIAEKQFARACEEIGFRGNIVCLWRHMDRDGNGHVSLLEMDSSAAVMLVDFKVLLSQQFGGKVVKFMQYVDENKSNRVLKDEWCHAFQKLNYQGSPKRLWEMLCRFNCGAITLKDLVFLEKWSPPRYLFAQGKPEMHQEWLQALKEAHESNMLRAWFKVLDTDQIMRVSWPKFQKACVRFARTYTGRPGQNLPKTEEDIAAVWRVLDEDCSGWIALREFDEATYEAASSFKHWADATYGGIAKFLTSPRLDICNLDGKRINRAHWRKALKDADFTKEVADLIFDGLDIHGQGTLAETDVKFLDKWDLVWEEWEANAHREDGVITASQTPKAKVKSQKPPSLDSPALSPRSPTS